MAKATTKTEKVTIEEITSQEDFKQFLSMLEVTSEDWTPWDDLSSDAQRDIINKFYLWKEKGSPKAEMPKLKDEKEDVITMLCRFKHRGIQYLYYETDDGRTIGREDIIQYAQEPELDENNQPTGKMINNNVVVKWDYKYTIQYDAKIGKEYLEKALKNDAVCKFGVPGTYIRCSDPESEFLLPDWRDVQKLMQNAPGIKGRRV
jgi:hypothetical protein